MWCSAVGEVECGEMWWSIVKCGGMWWSAVGCGEVWCVV